MVQASCTELTLPQASPNHETPCRRCIIPKNAKDKNVGSDPLQKNEGVQNKQTNKNWP